MARSSERDGGAHARRACRRVLRKPLPSRFEGTPATGVRSSRIVADTKLTAVELQHGSEEGVVAKTDVAHPNLAHGERSELVGQVSVLAREARLSGQRQMGHHRRFFLRDIII